MSNSYPDVTLSIRDGGLGQVPPSVAGAQVKMGICSDGIVGSIYNFGDTSRLSTTLGRGPMVEATADTLDVAGGPVYDLPLTPSTYGAAGGVTHTGTGAGTVTASLAPKASIAVKITTGGVLGTAFIAFSVNGGTYTTPIVTVAGPGSYRVPGTLTTVTLAAGTYVLNDVYTISALGDVTLSGSGPVAANVTHADSPLDVYDILTVITTGGAVGTAVFKVSVDGGYSYSAPIATAAKYAVPGIGVVLNFAGTFVADDTYEFTTTAASYSNSDVTAGFTTLLASSLEFGFVHLVGSPTSAAAAAATAAVVDTAMVAAETAYRFIFAITECPTTESDATVAAAFSTFQSKRVVVCAGDIRHISSLTGFVERRNCAWVVASRLGAIQPGEDAAWVGSPQGSIPHIAASPTGDSGLYRDEHKSPLLDASRFTTMYASAKPPGYFITSARTMAPPGSDFTYVVHRRLMDVACDEVRTVEVPFLNGSMRVDGQGHADEADATNFELEANAAIQAKLSGQISDSAVVISRTANLLSTNDLPVSIDIVPLFYARKISNSIGFSNPALAA